MDAERLAPRAAECPLSGSLGRLTYGGPGSKLAIHHMLAIDRFLEAIAREQTDRSRPISVTPDRMHE
jgi:hypothetical protein